MVIAEQPLVAWPWQTWLYGALLLLLGVERIVELAISKRNAAWALERGGVELGQGHFRFMTLLHSLFFVAIVAEVLLLPRPFRWSLALPFFALAAAAQGLRYWAIASLGRHWNVRVIVVPGAPAVRRGPFRYLRHPNYLAVIVEGFAVPLMHGAYLAALGFSLANALLLVVRIRCEERALEAHCGYAAAFAQRRRFWPGTSSRASAASSEQP